LFRQCQPHAAMPSGGPFLLTNQRPSRGVAINRRRAA
jgi:hypothetical protein